MIVITINSHFFKMKVTHICVNLKRVATNEGYLKVKTISILTGSEIMINDTKRLLGDRAVKQRRRSKFHSFPEGDGW